MKEDLIVDQYYNVSEIKWYENYALIILNTIKKHEIIICINKIKKECDALIYVVAHEYDETLIKTIFSLDIKDYLVMPLNHDYLVHKIIIDIDYYRKKKLSYFKFKKLYVDYNTMEAYIDNELINLTKIEFKILTLLITNIDCTLSKDYIIRKIWGYTTNDYRNLETHIKTLRKKLQHYKHQLITIYSHGYSFNSSYFDTIDY